MLQTRKKNPKSEILKSGCRFWLLPSCGYVIYGANLGAILGITSAKNRLLNNLEVT